MGALVIVKRCFILFFVTKEVAQQTGNKDVSIVT